MEKTGLGLGWSLAASSGRGGTARLPAQVGPGREGVRQPAWVWRRGAVTSPRTPHPLSRR
jgi:hypothetical protein